MTYYKMFGAQFYRALCVSMDQVAEMHVGLNANDVK